MAFREPEADNPVLAQAHALLGMVSRGGSPGEGERVPGISTGAAGGLSKLSLSCALPPGPTVVLVLSSEVQLRVHQDPGSRLGSAG